jgi:hypothetical protein
MSRMPLRWSYKARVQIDGIFAMIGEVGWTKLVLAVQAYLSRARGCQTQQRGQEARWSHTSCGCMAWSRIEKAVWENSQRMV